MNEAGQPEKCSTSLNVESIPQPHADWAQIFAFAQSFNAYDHWGSFERCAEIANAKRGTTLEELRTCLFFEARRWRHFGEEPDDGAMAYIRGIVQSIRDRVAAGVKGD